MGVVNATPDSFSDGGKYTGHKNFADRVRDIASRKMVIDIGAQSTAPNSKPISGQIEIERLQETLFSFWKTFPDTGPLIWSIDTYRSETIQKTASMAEGRTLWWNDVSSQIDHSVWEFLRQDPNRRYIYCCSAIPTREDSSRHLDFCSPLEDEDFLRQFCQQLANTVKKFEEQNLASQLVLDPGLGLAKTRAQNQLILRRLNQIVGLVGSEIPWLIGVSRKSFLRDSRHTKLAPHNKMRVDILQALLIHQIEKHSAFKNRTVIWRIHDLDLPAILNAFEQELALS